MTHGLLKVVGITALAAGIAFSQNGPGGQRGQHGRGEMIGRLGADLNLTDTQKQQMRSIFMSSHQAAQSVDEQIKTNRDALAAAVKSGAPEAEIDRLSASLGTAGSYKEIGDMLGPLSVGALSQAFGLAAGFVACGVAGLASILLVGRGEPS